MVWTRGLPGHQTQEIEIRLSPIHPTAIISTEAQLDSSVEVGPYTIIEGPVQIGPNTRILNNVHISGNTVIGPNNEIHMGAVIGHLPQHKNYKNAHSGLIIGQGNVIREYASIHRAYHPGENTVIGDENFLMGYSHIAHDCQVGDRVVLANGALLAGHAHVDDGANISGNVAVHQYVRIGKLAMIGGLARVSKDVPPYMLVEGNSTVRGINAVGLRRAGFSLDERRRIKNAYRILYRIGLNVPQALETLDQEDPDTAPVRELANFIRRSVRGICRHAPIHQPDDDGDDSNNHSD